MSLLSGLSPNYSEETPIFRRASSDAPPSYFCCQRTRAGTSRSVFQRIRDATSCFFDSPWTIGSMIVGGVSAIVFSAISITPVLKAYVDDCVEDLNYFSPNLPICRAPYQTAILTYQAVATSCCGIIGIFLQKWVQNSVSTAESQVSTAIEKIKKTTLTIQSRFSYEIHIGLGYLYNGLWPQVYTIPSWVFYFQCQSAAISLAGGTLGMYLYIQYRMIKEQLESRREEGQEIELDWHLKEIVVFTSSGIVLLVIPFSIASMLSHQNSNILKEIGIMILCRPLGHLLIGVCNWSQEHSSSTRTRKICNVVLPILRKSPSILVASGYSIYLFCNVNFVKFAAIGVLGVAMGIKDSSYQYQAIVSVMNNRLIESLPSKCGRCAQRVWHYVKKYFRTALLAAALIVCEKSSILECYSVAYYSCPVSFELSGDYINIDGKGVGIAIATGLAQFWAMEFFQSLYNRPHNILKNVAKGYLYLVDKYHFDLLSMMPYAMIRSGEYIPDFKAYACYNPIGLLFLVGLTMGTYNNKIQNQRTDPYRLPMSDTGALDGLIV